MNSLQRFLNAQENDYFIALREMREGKKRTHWMWYIFPILKGQGHRYYARLYGLDGLAEAKAFLAHPVLGKRLRDITEAVLTHPEIPIRFIMSSDTDTWKFHASMTLFDALSPDDVFAKALNTFFEGKRDGRTLKLISK